MTEYGIQNNKRNRYSLVGIDNLSEDGWGLLVKKKHSKSITSEFSNNNHKNNRCPTIMGNI